MLLFTGPLLKRRLRVETSNSLGEYVLSITAIFWIRDGVLIDRMPVNAVAFAFACMNQRQSVESTGATLTDLINFAFATSGISCAEKMRKFNAENQLCIPDVQAATEFYNNLSAEAGGRCQYFAGALELLQRSCEVGVLNFITSAVEQTVLDRWSVSDQGRSVTPFLTEILGWRSPEFCKGVGHFKYAREHYGIERIIYVADAVAEIASGSQHSQDYDVVPIGFAHLITQDKIMHALTLVSEAYAGIEHRPWQHNLLQPERLVLPDQSDLDRTLTNAGAVHLVSGSGEKIMGDLADLLTATVFKLDD